MATIKELSDKGPDGTRLGQSAADLIGFHGATPSAQSAAVTLATGATAATIVTAVQSLLAKLRTKGIIAT
jgi:hypothetical protein